MNKPTWATAPAVLDTDRARNGQSLLPPPEVLADVPPVYATENVPPADKTVWLHYFVGSADWWLVELNPESGLAFGYASLGDPQLAEWGYVDLTELATVRVPIRLLLRERPRREVQLEGAVERDEHWTPVKVSDCAGIQAIVAAGGRA